MKKRLFLFLSLCLFAVSCGKEASTAQKMSRFAASYGKVGCVYSLAAKEGEDGYVGEDFFVALYGKRPQGLSDFAVFLGEELACIEECGALKGETNHDALTLYEVAQGRVLFLLSYQTEDGCKEESFLCQYGKTVVYGVFSDGERAKTLLDAIF